MPVNAGRPGVNAALPFLRVEEDGGTQGGRDEVAEEGARRYALLSVRSG